METKLIAMILGVALVLATAATVYTRSANAFFGRGGFNGVAGGPCSANSNVENNNPNCSQTPTGAGTTNSAPGYGIPFLL